MTGEVSPPGDGPGNEAMPELRASHEDRDRVVEILRVAAGDGRLSGTELDERVEAALTARTYRELAQLTADLPAVPGQPGPAVPGAGQGPGPVSGEAKGGHIVARPPRRTFRQWLLRRPGPYGGPATA